MSTRESTGAPPGACDLHRNRPNHSVRWIHSQKRLQHSSLPVNARLQAESRVFTKRLARRGAPHTACAGTIASVTRVGTSGAARTRERLQALPGLRVGCVWFREGERDGRKAPLMSTGLQRALWLAEPILFPSVLRMEKRGKHILSFCLCPTLMAAGAAGGL